MVLKAFSSRHDLTIENLEENFDKTLYEEGAFSFVAGFALHDEDTDEVLATVKGRFFDEDKILNESEDIVDIADMIDSDTYDAIFALTKSKIYQQELNDDNVFLSLFTCYIERIYVYPKHRDKGIGSYILKNLDLIFLYCFNTPIHSFVIVPKPQQPGGKSGWENAPDEDGRMLKMMINRLKKEGYRKIGKTNFYAKNCAV